MKIPHFNYALMELLCKELQASAIGLKVAVCYPNDLHRFQIVLHEKNHLKSIFFSFTAPFMRFHLLKNPVMPKFSAEMHPMNLYLKDAIFKQVELLFHDRILQITFHTPKKELLLFVAEFFFKHPNYYILKANQTILFSLHPLGQEKITKKNATSHYRPPQPHSILKEKPSWHNHEEVEDAYFAMEQQWELLQEKQSLTRTLKKQIKRLERNENALRDNLKLCGQWDIIQHEGDLIKANLSIILKGSSAIKVTDWLNGQPLLIELNPAKSALEEMAARYKRAKKLLAGKEPLMKQLEQTQSRLLCMRKQLENIQLAETLQELAEYQTQLRPPIRKQIAPTRTESASSIYYEFNSANGTKIWVGKNAKANDKLTFNLSNGRDWWMHTRGIPGSHVVIRMDKDQEPDAETLLDAMQLALHYSKARGMEECEVCYTQRKYVSRLGKGKPGLVQMSKQQSAWARSDRARLQNIKARRQY